MPRRCMPVKLQHGAESVYKSILSALGVLHILHVLLQQTPREEREGHLDKVVDNGSWENLGEKFLQLTLLHKSNLNRLSRHLLERSLDIEG